jgi:leucyl-tRNA synthetase
VREGIEQFKFNTAIAALMELLNVLEKEVSVPIVVLETYVLLLAPFAPHLAAEVWQILGRPGSIQTTAWPAFRGEILDQAQRLYAVQVNGKVRGSLSAAPSAEQAYIEEQARALPGVARHIGEQPLRKVVFVPDRLINFVIK